VLARKLVVGFFAVTLALAACRTEAPIPAQRFEVRGKVVAVNKDERTVTVAHEEIPGYMAAMTMSYRLKDQWAFDVLKPGQAIHATLVVDNDHAWLEGIVIAGQPKPESTSLAPLGSAESPLGSPVPDFQLVNQDGQRIHLHQYHGKALLLTFIYTRCPLPDYCPLMSKNFAQLTQELRSNMALATSTHLLSVSIDPDYDKPSVLRSYGMAYIDKTSASPFQGWEFVSGTPQQVRQVAEFFGLSYSNEQGQIVHSLVTALIDPDGKVRKLYRGNQWQPADVVADLRSIQ
jgi:protein SCO1/2